MVYDQIPGELTFSSTFVFGANQQMLPSNMLNSDEHNKHTAKHLHVSIVNMSMLAC